MLTAPSISTEDKLSTIFSPLLCHSFRGEREKKSLHKLILNEIDVDESNVPESFSIFARYKFERLKATRPRKALLLKGFI